MGRSRFGSIVSRPFVIWPMIRSFAEPGAGVDLTTGMVQPVLGASNTALQWGSKIAYLAGSGAPPGLGAARAVQAGYWSISDCATDASTLYVLHASKSGSNVLCSNNNQTEQAVIVGGHQNGSWLFTVNYGSGDPLGAGPFLNESPSVVSALYPGINNTATGQIRGLFLNTLIAPQVPHIGGMPSDNGPRFFQLYRPISHNPGPMSGFYVTFPLMYGTQTGQASGVVNTSQNNIIVRQMTAPFDMRVVAVTVGAFASAAGNSLKVRNETQGADVCGTIALTSGSPSAAWVQAASLTARDIRRGDLIAVRAVTAGTGGMTDGYAMVVAYCKGFHTDESWRDLPGSRVGASGVVRAPGLRHMRHFRSSLSGPAAGGTAALPFSARTIASGQTNAPVSRCIVPATGRILGIGFAHGVSAAGNSGILYNVTKAREIHTEALTATAAATVAANDYNGTTFTGNAEVEQGDVLELRATTGGTSISTFGANALMHVREHVNSNPLYD